MTKFPPPPPGCTHVERYYRRCERSRQKWIAQYVWTRIRDSIRAAQDRIEHEKRLTTGKGGNRAMKDEKKRQAAITISHVCAEDYRREAEEEWDKKFGNRCPSAQ